MSYDTYSEHDRESITPETLRCSVNAAIEVLAGIDCPGDTSETDPDEVWASISPNSVLNAYEDITEVMEMLERARNELVQQLATKPWVEG